jgi:predicted dehydrogenase
MKFLIIGFGSAGQRHARVLRENINSQDEILIYRKNSRIGLISSDLTFENKEINPILFYKGEEIINLTDIKRHKFDLAIIATPPDSHYEYFNLVKKYSSKILIEKPITVNSFEASEIISYSKTNNFPIYIGYQNMFHPAVVDIKKLILKTGEIKKIKIKHIENLDTMNPFRSMASHHLNSSLGGGAFLGLSHELNLALNIFSDHKIKNFKSTGSKVLDKSIEFTFDLVGNKTINIEGILDLISFQKERSIQFIGDRGIINWDLTNNQLKATLNGIEIRNSIFQIEKDELYALQLQHVLSQNFDLPANISILEKAQAIVEVFNEQSTRS